MTALGAAWALAATGFHFSVPDARASATEPRRAYHVHLIVGCTCALAAAAPLVPWLAPWIIGVWFSLLACLYAGHSAAVRHWGSPMSRDAFTYGVRNLGRLSKLKPGPTAAALALVALAFMAGFGAARIDEGLVPTPARIAGGAVGWFACRAGARRARKLGGFDASIDILVGVLRDGHGPQGPPPPHDPAFGFRGFPPGTFEPARKPNVILFVIDSARAAHFSINGYERRTTPFLGSLIERGARSAPLCLSVGASSEAGLWGLLSSRRARHQAVNAPCLHDVRRSIGYTLRFLCSGIHRNSMGLEQLYGDDVDQFEDLMIDEALLERVRDLPSSPPGAPSFLFFHLMSTHSMSGKDPDVVWSPSRDRLTAPRGGVWDEASRQPFINHYDNTLLQADTYLRQMTACLQDKGYLDDAIVIVTGDHGEHVLDRDSLVGHNLSLYQEAVHIPLLVWDTKGELPPPAPLSDQTDIAPTVLALMGLASPSSFQGQPIFGADHRTSSHLEHTRHRVGEPSTHMEALIVRRGGRTFKALRHSQNGRLVLSRVFCLTTDPLEQTDLSSGLDDETRVALNEEARRYRELPAVTLSTTWRHLNLPSTSDSAAS